MCSIADAHAAAVGGDVLRLKLGVDLLFVDAELRQALPRDFEKDDLLLFAEEIDLLHILHEQQLAAQELDVAAQFGKEKPSPVIARKMPYTSPKSSITMDAPRTEGGSWAWTSAILRRSSSQTCGIESW